MVEVPTPEDVDLGNDPEADAPEVSGDPVRRWTLILLALALVLLVIHLRADRFTPYTSQARLNALVVPIAAEVAGSIVAVEVANNELVTAGETLFRIDPDRYELAVQTAQANLEAARQAVGVSTANVESARAAVASAQSRLRQSTLDFERLQRIAEEDPGAISERRVESAGSSRDVAEAQLESARANLNRALEDLGREGEENSRILQAQAALNQALIDLGNTTVVAPGDGVVTDVRIDRGTFAAAGAPQMTFIGTTNVWVQADFTENNLGHLDPGDEVEILFDVLPGRVFAGTVREIGFGVQVDSAPLGTLPTIQNDRNWLRDAQRFSVLVDLNERPGQENVRRLKVGSQASVIVYTDGHPLLRWLGRLYIRAASILTYAY
ncbi:MAG: HlyD family secretion protein [Gammaproteobacteria bacterium]|jgi:multidrug resistance efflux pump